MHRRKYPTLLAAAALLPVWLSAAEKQPNSPAPAIAFRTPVKADNLDSGVYAEWVDGSEKRIPANDKGAFGEAVIWTEKSSPGIHPMTYGESKHPGWRHMRVGFGSAVPVGSVLVMGGGRLSVLKPGAAYPGNLADDADWIDAQRLHNGQVSNIEVAEGNYGVWVLPAGTQTRALRFSHLAAATDVKYGGVLGAALVIGDRFSNAATQATVSTSARNHRAGRLTNSSNDNTWSAWDNLDKDQPEFANEPVISSSHAEWVLLAWPAPVKLSGLVTLWTGFTEAEVQTYSGPADRHPRDAGDEAWAPVAAFRGLESGYPSPLWPNRLDFAREITTRAVRLRITAPVMKASGHLAGRSLEGRRVWLGELMALQPLGDAPLEAAMPAAVAVPTAPIAVRFNLKQAGFVSLVIEKPDGVRVRNLVAETWFEKGDNVAWWDGLDDLGRDVDAARHGLYKIPARFVDPGEYRVRGLVRGAITPHYEFSVYTTGSPPWSTADHTGAWLANHSPPMAALFVPGPHSPTGAPAVYLGCYVTEGPDGLGWVDLDGRKRGGKKWIGGNWTAAPYLARDAGPAAVPGIYAYVGSVWETAKKSGISELRITALSAGEDKPVIVHQLAGTVMQHSQGEEIGGLAVYDGVAVVSLTRSNQLLFIDAKAGKVLGSAPLQKPMGLAFDAKARLLVLSESKLLRFDSIADPARLPQPKRLIDSGLEAPVGLTLDDAGRFFISDAGASHQVKVFTSEGVPAGVIGKPGAPKAGPYDPLHMNNPAGLAIDSSGQLWVAEADFLPKRVSVWSLDGKFIRAFYGPGKYGGGGCLDPQDKTRFYYGEEGRGAIEFKIDWQTGDSRPVQIYYRSGQGTQELATRSAGPETALYYKGRRFFTNCYNSSPTGGHPTAFLFADRDGIACPVAAMGSASHWELLKTPAFKTRWPDGVDLNANGDKNQCLFAWDDLNADAQVQPEEVSFQKGLAGGVTVMADLAFCVARVGENSMRFAPTGFNAAGIPLYDLAAGQILASGVHGPASSGGNQVLAGPDGWSVVTLGMRPFDARSFSGAKNGVPMWSYPNLWPGLHASHEAPLPSQAGELSGPTRLVGGLFEPAGSKAGPLWAVNGNHGNIYVFTTDGLFVATLFKGMRVGKRWGMPAATRNMSLDGITLGEENFWPTLTQTADGLVYLVDGARSSLVRLDGLESLQRLPESRLTVTAADLEKGRAFLVETEAVRQRSQGSGLMEVSLRNAPPRVDANLDDWKTAGWADIDQSGVKANFNSASKPYDVSGALSVAGDRLYAAFRTGDDKLLQNSGEMPVAPFKTGGALDLMLGTDPRAKSGRLNPVAGDLRLLVTVVKGKPRALLYRAVVAGTKDKVPFSSPARTTTFDSVADVTEKLEFAAAAGSYEFSIPLDVLGLHPADGISIKGDIGILRGSDGETNARVYWNNKATGITSDVPSEAALTPALWGTLNFKRQL